MDVLTGLGAHCSEGGCGQLDFLPFTCPGCQGVYCLAHHKPTDHTACSTELRENRNTMPLCPLCHQFVYAPVDMSRDVAVEAHITSGCVKHLLSAHTAHQRSALAAHTRCALTGCKNIEKLSTIECARCSGQYCLRHRLPVMHKCASLPVGESLESSSKRKAPSAPSSAAPVDKHAAGNALLAKLKAKREAKEASAAQSAAAAAHDRAHASAFPVNPAAAAVPIQEYRPI